MFLVIYGKFRILMAKFSEVQIYIYIYIYFFFHIKKLNEILIISIYYYIDLIIFFFEV